MAELQVRGIRTHVIALGSEGPPIIFLHGLVMDNLSSWYFTLANPVSAFGRVWLYDLRGHGRSERPPDGYSLDELVEDLHALREVVGIDEPMILVGNSFGGLLALAYGTAHPEHLAGLVLVDALLPEPGWGDGMTATLSLTGEQRNAMIADSFKSWLGRSSKRKTSKLARQAEGLVEGTSLLDDVRGSPGLPLAALAVIDCPVLAIYGENSDVRPAGERLATTLPHCTLEVREGCTHSVLWEQTAELKERIVGWLQELA